jgi:hypothetical protein
MSTVGYGDIHPTTRDEVLYVMGMTMLACCMFAYTVNMIGTIFMNQANRESKYLQKKYHLFKYLRNREVSPRLQQEII